MSDALDLLILDAGSTGRAVAYAQSEADTAVAVLSCQAISQLKDFRDRLNRATNGQEKRPTPQDLTSFGTNLFNFVLRDNLLTLYNRLPSEYIRIRILSNHAEVQALPWEYLQDPRAPSGPDNNRGVVRIVPTLGQPMPKPRKIRSKLAILFAFADPIDQDTVRWQDIYNTIKREFEQRLGNNFEIDIVEGATIQAVTQALLKKSYDVFHFNGHGALLPNTSGEKVGHLVFMNFATKKSEPISAERLATLVRGQGLQLVILSSCDSSAGDFTKSYAVVAQSLVSWGVPAVVANQFAVSNNVAATFSSGLYNELLKSGDIDRAVGAGRLVLSMQPQIAGKASLEWGIPTLYRHLGAARIFET
jgi:hypothetical protein